MHMSREQAIEKFRKACRLMREVHEAGFSLYLEGSGNMNMMRGPSHDVKGDKPLRDNVVVSVYVPGASGGAW